MLKRTDTISFDTDWFYRKGGKLFYRWTDRIFNGLNNRADKIFVRRLPDLATRFFRAPGVHLQKLILVPYYRLQGLGTGALQQEMDRVERRASEGSYPVGVGVLLAVLFLAAMSLLFFMG
jgi:multicomponent Na+:H+ antiporter subunit D